MNFRYTYFLMYSNNNSSFQLIVVFNDKAFSFLNMCFLTIFLISTCKNPLYRGFHKKSIDNNLFKLVIKPLTLRNSRDLVTGWLRYRLSKIYSSNSMLSTKSPSPTQIVLLPKNPRYIYFNKPKLFSFTWKEFIRERETNF